MIKQLFIAIIYIFISSNIILAEKNQDFTQEEHNNTQTIKIGNVSNSTISEHVSAKVKHLHIIFSGISDSTIDIHIPESVEDINISSTSYISDSDIILYYPHAPHITKQNIMLSDSSIKSMHPIRQYTYHGIAILGAMTAAGLIMTAWD